jgi:hypothetical protein
MNQELLDLYVDYLISSFGATTATGLSKLLGGQVSHDQITRMLTSKKQDSAAWWQGVKPQVRKRQSDEGVMIIDDSIEEKPYTDENAIVCWHYDHSKDRLVKGLNFMTLLYHTQEMSLPVGFTLIAKTEHYVDKKDGKTKRKSPVTKNEYARQMQQQAGANQIPFKYVLNDVWFASAEDMGFIKQEVKKDFIMPVKTNRKVALSLEEKLQGKYVRVDTLLFESNTPKPVYLEGVPFPLLLVKQVFTNDDGSTGVLYWVTSETILCAFVRLELLSSSTKFNHFALKTKLYVAALQSAFEQLRQLQLITA